LKYGNESSNFSTRFAKVERILPVIVATAILHNIVRRAGDPLPDDLALQLPWEEILNQGNISLMNDASVIIMCRTY